MLTALTIDTLQPILDPFILEELTRVYYCGCPAVCNGESPESNKQAFMTYDNHPANAHKSPIGITDLDHPIKNPRPFFDATFCPAPDKIAINDITTKATEHPLFFPEAFLCTMVWIWNLRISYPYEEILVVDDDITGAFRNLSYHPALVTMHSFIIAGFLFMYNRLTFGYNTSPSNFKIIARAGAAVAQYLWNQGESATQHARKYLPPINLQPQPSQIQYRQFLQAISNTQNTGVFNSLRWIPSTSSIPSSC